MLENKENGRFSFHIFDRPSFWFIKSKFMVLLELLALTILFSISPCAFANNEAVTFPILPAENVRGTLS